MSSSTAPEWVQFFRKQLEMVILLNSVLFIVVNNYARPALNLYRSAFGNVYVLIEKQLVPLSQPITPAKISMPMQYNELSDYAKLYEYLKSKGINLSTLVSIEPNWDVYNLLGSYYCPETMTKSDRAVCLLKNTPRIIYHLCTEKAPAGDAEPEALITELMSNSKYVTCAISATRDAKFNVTVDLDMVLSFMNDIVQAVMNMAHQYYGKVSEAISAYVVARLLFASRVLMSLINKRVGDVFNTPPEEFVSELMRVYNTVSGTVDSLSKAMLTRIVV